MSEVRKGQAEEKISRDEFRRRFRGEFYDPEYRNHDGIIATLEAVAWNAYSAGRKAPITEKAGPSLQTLNMTCQLNGAKYAIV